MCCRNRSDSLHCSRRWMQMGTAKCRLKSSKPPSRASQLWRKPGSQRVFAAAARTVACPPSPTWSPRNWRRRPTSTRRRRPRWSPCQRRTTTRPREQRAKSMRWGVRRRVGRRTRQRGKCIPISRWFILRVSHRWRTTSPCQSHNIQRRRQRQRQKHRQRQGQRRTRRAKQTPKQRARRQPPCQIRRHRHGLRNRVAQTLRRLWVRSRYRSLLSCGLSVPSVGPQNNPHPRDPAKRPGHAANRPRGSTVLRGLCMANHAP
mmetsp:Transcript_15938/g.38040  ORF Transcript_15938/g.38040 Transcript_15938/m.38040 type:complete len:260 (-) Transcript_15938:210-989(-)